MSSLPTWVSYLQALATPAIAFAGWWVARSNYVLAKQKRHDDLFDRRFGLLKRIRDFQRHLYLETSSESLIRNIDDLVTEARFLFGEQFASELEEVLNKTGKMAPFDSDPAVSRLFMSKMNFGAK